MPSCVSTVMSSIGISALLDIPEDEGVRFKHARNVLAPQEGLLELTKRNIGHDLPEAAMHRLDQRLLFRGISLGNVLLAHRLFGFIAWPTDEVLAVAGHDRRRAGQRACRAGAVGAGMEEVPAALIGRVLLGAAGRHGAPIRHL